MTELSPEARRTLMAARAAADPTTADKERGKLLLAAAIATTVGVTTTTAAAATAAQGTAKLGLALGAKFAAGSLALGLAVATSVVLTRPPAPVSPAGVDSTATHAATTTDEPAVAPTANGMLAAAPTVAPNPRRPTAGRHPASTPTLRRHPTEHVAEEVAWIGRAERALEAGQLREALLALDAHARQFRDGQLQPERHGLRAIVLCTMSDSRGRAEATRFLRHHPWSAMTTRVRTACLPPLAATHGDGSDEP